MLRTLLGHTLPLALIPAISWFIGVSQSGWQIAGDLVRLTSASALPMCVLFYLAMVAGVLFLGYMVAWMSGTYDAVTQDGSAMVSPQINIPAAVRLISCTATPFFLAGFLGLAPSLWLDLLAGTGVAIWCVYLLYAGLPTVMRVPPERGFLYASAVLAVALVAFVGLLTVTVLLWEFGPNPMYRY